ncbi:MAG: response regulator transcription factor [Flavobacterium sp.]|nr:response regulator transcription factor [Candidatus Neoflavobacterium equi]
MKIKAIIVDDEQNARQFLKGLCERYFSDQIEIVEVCNSVQSAVVAIKQREPQLVFLDIEMPNQNGFELFNILPQINFEVVFTTAHDNFAIKAFKYSALDYVLKPVGEEDIRKVIEKINKKKYNGSQLNKIALLMENLNSSSAGTNKIVLSTTNGFDVVNLNSIIYCEASGAYCNVATLDRKKTLYTKSLKEICDLIQDASFFRTHRSFLINKNFVKSYDRLLSQVLMVDGSKIPVASRIKSVFLDAFQF